MKKAICVAFIPLALAGCVSFEETGAGDAAAETTPPPPVSLECDASKGQYAIGQKTSVELGGKLVKETGSATLRWIPPRTAVTMDYRGDRLNIGYDDDMVINKVSCG